MVGEIIREIVCSRPFLRKFFPICDCEPSEIKIRVGGKRLFIERKYKC